MKTAFVITSAINVSNDHPLTYSNVRSYFDPQERLRQTIFTVNSIRQATDPAETTIWIVDASKNLDDYINYFNFYPNVRFVSFANDFPEYVDDVLTHPNKSHCECTILSHFFKKYEANFADQEAIFKLSGRYFLDNTFQMSLVENNPDKIYYKRYLEFDWQDSWGYEKVDLRKEQGNLKLRQYCTVFFGWSKKYHHFFVDLFTSVSRMLDEPKMYHYDIETLYYFLTRQHSDDIIETDWMISGWDGTSGRFVRY
jgi:hypothetical protein